MNRLSCLFRCRCTWVFLLLAGFTARIDAEQPNILWITSEDNSAHWLGAYGDPVARTPHLDQLSAEGVRYLNAYANSPVCAVARFTLFTGTHAVSMGTQNMRSRYAIPEEVLPYVHYLRQAGYYCTNNLKTDYNYATDDSSHWDDSSDEAHWRNRPDKAPFFAIFNLTASHESSLFAYSGSEKLVLQTSPDNVELPPFLPDTEAIRSDWAAYYDVLEKMDHQAGVILEELEQANLHEDTIVFYFSDHGGILPRAKRYIYDTGTRVPLIIRFPEKYRQLASAPVGATVSRPVSFVDFAPTLLQLAGIEIPSSMQGRAFLGEPLTDSDDVFLYGQRFDSEMYRFERALTDGITRYILNFHPHRPRASPRGYMFNQQGWVSWREAWQSGSTDTAQSAAWLAPQTMEELYHTETDPWEVRNLAADPVYAEQVEHLRNRLLTRMRKMRDTGIVPEVLYAELTRETTLYEAVRDPVFPYEDILNLAVGAASNAPGTTGELQDALSHPHPVMQYWGIMGFEIRGSADREAKRKLIYLLEHEVEGLRLAAARALLVLGDGDPGVAALEKLIRNTKSNIIGMEALWALYVHKETGGLSTDELHSLGTRCPGTPRIIRYIIEDADHQRSSLF